MRKLILEAYDAHIFPKLCCYEKVLRVCFYFFVTGKNVIEQQQS